MTNRLIAVLIIFPIWLTLVIVFRRHRQWLLYYLVAAFGMTLQIVFLAEYFGLDQVLVNIASYHVDLISKYIFHLPIELLSNGRFQITLPDGTVSILKLGIECSAVLESSICVSLVIFYPLFNISQKILRATFGLIVTYVINIARLMIIVLMAYKFGPDYIFVAHAGVARIFFFVCELILYWYLITKPTVRSVGESILSHENVTQAAKVGHALRLRHAIGQLMVIFIVIGLSIYSFLVSDEWYKAFTNISYEPRPLIFKETTEIVPMYEITPAPAPKQSSQNQDALNKELTMDLEGGQKKEYRFEITKEEELNVQVLLGNQDLASRLILNGENIALVAMAPWRFNKQISIFDPIKVKPGDVLELRFQNLAEESSKYVVKVFPNDEINNKIAKEVAGISTSAINKELTMDLQAGEKTEFYFEITKEEKLNVQVLLGNQDLACRFMINDVSVAFTEMSQWRFDQQNIFEPIKVRPGDILKLKFQNLSDAQGQYSIKVFPNEEINVE